MKTLKRSVLKRGYFFTPFGFTFDRDTRFEIGGRKFRLGMRGVRVLRILAAIESHRSPGSNVYWLLPFRAWFWELQQMEPRVYLTILAMYAKSNRLRCLAIWLRGRCGGNFGIQALASLSDSQDRAVCKHVAQSLKKLGAWSELRRIEETETDPQIRQIAKQSAPRPASERRANFLKHVPRRAFSSKKPPLFVSPEVDFQHGKPAKPLSIIRAVLERIHRLVAGWKA